MRARSTLLGLLLAFAVIGSVQPVHARPDEGAGDDVGAIDSAVRERSRAAFRRGVTQLRAQDWAGARASFEEAWSLVQHPSILLNLGIARLRTDEPVLAEQDLVRFLSEDPGAAPEELVSAREALAEARSKIGTLRVNATPAFARVMVDGTPASVRAPASEGQGGVAEVRLKAGSHSVLVAAEGFASDERSVDVRPKSDTEIHVALVGKDAARASSDGAAIRTIAGWSLVGVSGVAAVAGGVMALRALSLSSDYGERGNPSFQNTDVKDEGIAFRTGADIALVTALVAGAGAVLLLLTDIGEPSSVGVARLAAKGPAARTYAPPPALFRW